MNLKAMKIGQTVTATPGEENPKAFLLMEKSGFMVKYDSKTGKGKASLKGISFDYTTGDENFYFDLPNLYIKNADKEAVEALKKFLAVVSNYGGSSK